MCDKGKGFYKIKGKNKRVGENKIVLGRVRSLLSYLRQNGVGGKDWFGK